MGNGQWVPGVQRAAARSLEMAEIRPMRCLTWRKILACPAGDAGDTPNKREKRATMRNGDGELPVSSIMLRG